MPQQPAKDDFFSQFESDEDFFGQFEEEQVVKPPVVSPTAVGPTQQPSMLSRAWNTLTTPLSEAPSTAARSMAGLEQPTEGGFLDAFAAIPDVARNLWNEPAATIKGFGQGVVEGVGNVLSQETSPLALASTAIGAPRPVRQGIVQGVKGARQGIGKGISSIASRIMGKPATEAVESTGDILAKPVDFNPPVSSVTPTPPVTAPKTVNVWLKNPTPEKVRDAAAQGYKFGGKVREDGAFQMVKSETPLEVPVLESDVAKVRPTKAAATEQRIARGELGPKADVRKASAIEEAINFPRGVMASWDFSAPLRQGLPLIHRKQWWTSFDDMFKSWGSETAFQAVQKSISDKPLFRPRPNPKDPTKMMPSFAEEAGLKLTDLTDLSKREEAVMSTWAEKVPGVRRSNRAYVAFLNKLRADTFEDLTKKFKVLGESENNLALARELAQFVNNATGRGSLGSLEQSASTLNSIFFSPRLIASRLNMFGQGGRAAFSPEVYMMTQPSVRREYLKSLISVAAVGGTLGQLAKMGGGTVESDPTSSDFGKIKIGNTRLDPFGGFQQYVVLANRLLQGRTKSSISGREYNLGEEFGRPTRLDVAGRFAEGKLHPVWSFATGLLRGKDFTGQPFNVPQEMANRVLPIIFQDIYELSQEDPTLLPFAVPASLGVGVQTYESQ